MLTAFLIEDSILFRQAFKGALCRRFPWIQIEEAANGKEVLQRIKESLPDIIFVDVRLPGESGFELTKRIKASYPWITVVVLTHYDLKEYQEAAEEAGADRFISKESLDLAEIASLLESMILEKKRQGLNHATRT